MHNVHLIYVARLYGVLPCSACRLGLLLRALKSGLWPVMVSKIIVSVSCTTIFMILPLLMLNHCLMSFFVRFLLIQRQTHEYCEGLNFDEICKSRSVTWTVYVNTWKKVNCPNFLWSFSQLKWWREMESATLSSLLCLKSYDFRLSLSAFKFQVTFLFVALASKS